VFVQPAANPRPIAPAMVKGAQSIGIPAFENQNGVRMEMEDEGGCVITDVRYQGGNVPMLSIHLIVRADADWAWLLARLRY